MFNEGIAKVAEQYLKKGMKVYIEGALQTRKWQKDGVDHYQTEVVLQKFRGELQMLESADRADKPRDNSQDYERESGGTPKHSPFAQDLDDEIPF